MKKKSSEFNGVPNNGVFVKSAIQVAVLLLSTGAIANAQDATPAAPAAGDIQTVTVTSTGTRGKQRTMTSTPVPVDVLSAKDLVKTGQVTLDKALQYTVPSFNTVQTPVNDATSLLDPYEIRNMGPSRSLILINGKRKNSSALIYTQTSPGRGESGADISAIPQDAIKRIEVLRDGASAQYGSDAISGVVNIILKDNASGGSVTARTGMTGERDGKMGGLSLNQGLSLGGKGFFNYTVDVSKSQLSSRSGKVSAEGEADPDFGFGADLNQVKAFLAKYPDARNINGSPETRATKFLFNTRYDLTDDLSIYGNAAYVNKKINSFANYRTPYWRPTDYGLLHAAGTPYEGYQPGFVGALDDYNATVGTKFTMMGWASDISLTLGGNKQGYTVTNSVNRDLAEKSPTTFDGGGSKFSHTVINADFSKELMASVNGYFGTELRSEKYETLAGEPASYFGRGSDSYAGNSPANSFPSERKNYGVYAGSSWDVSKQLLLDLTGRFEHYSDFGNATIGKLSGRYQFDDTVTLRSSISTGFRAPSLHQIYTSKKQYSFSGGQIQVSGIANNVSPEAKALGVPQLQPEKSTSFTLGLGLNPDKDTSITLDYYNIALKNRIILGKEIHPSAAGNQPLDKILSDAGIVSLAFFSNALDSKTSGIDYVVNRRNIVLGDAKVALNLSGNYSLKNERDGSVHNIASVANAGQSVLDSTQEALIFTSRPKFKTIFGTDFDIGKYNLSVNNTVFGPTRFRNADSDENVGVVFKTKTVTDFAVNYSITKDMTLTFNINNLFNVTPSWSFEAVADKAKGQAILDSKAVNAFGLTPTQVLFNRVTFDGRYSVVTYDGSHFSQLGRMFNLSLNYRF